MPALDQCHDQFVTAFRKDGWVVSDKPLHLSIDTRSILVDIYATKTFPERKEQLLMIEVKCFADQKHWTSDLYSAIGQYIIYQSVCDILNLNIPLFLGIPLQAYENIFDLPAQYAIQRHDISLVIVEIENEEIVQWIR